jgi:hypothetical protein
LENVNVAILKKSESTGLVLMAQCVLDLEAMGMEEDRHDGTFLTVGFSPAESPTSKPAKGFRSGGPPVAGSLADRRERLVIKRKDFYRCCSWE